MSVASRAVLFVLDGLRPDLITSEHTPHLMRLVEAGTRFERGHAVLPTVTRVNSASLATGLLPAGHGLPANLLFAPKLGADLVSLGEGDSVPELMRAYGVFAAPTLLEILAEAGGSTALASTGTRGSALMQDPRRAARTRPNAATPGHLTLHPTLSTADTLDTAAEHVGPLPEAAVPDSGRNRWLARAAAEWIVPKLRPDILSVWFDDPDKSQHRFGFGHPESLRAIREVDGHVGRILDAIDAAGLRDETIVAVASDHGYVGVSRHVDLAGLLGSAGHDRTANGSPVVVAPNGCAALIYAPSGTDAELGRIAEVLRASPEVGVVFSGKGAFTGSGAVAGGGALPGAGAVAGSGARPVIDGTFPLGAIRMSGPLAPDLLVTLGWSDAPNEYGHGGTGVEHRSANRASHGGASPWEIRNTMLLAGPGIRRGVRSELPSGNVDLAPTLLTLLGLPVPPDLDGRVLHEAFVGTSAPASASGADGSSVARTTDRIAHTHGHAELHWSEYAGSRYLDFAKRVAGHRE